MIAALVLASVLTVGPSDTPAWREDFLILSTGRAPFRNLQAFASRRLGSELHRTAGWMAGSADPAATRDWLVLHRVASDRGPSAGPLFAAALAASPSDTQRWMVVMAIAAALDSAQAPVVADLLASPDRRLRSLAAVALGDLATPRHLPALIRALEDEHAPVRRAAADAIERLASRHPVAGWAWNRRAEAAAALGEAAGDTDAWTRRNARRALGVVTSAPAWYPEAP